MLIRNIKTRDQLIKFYFESTKENELFINEKLGFLSKNQINRKPQPGVWSVGECIRHMIASHQAHHPILQKSLKFVAENNNDYPFKHSLIGKFIIKGVNPENIRKVKTLKIYQPDSSDIDEKIFQEYFAVQKQTTDFVNRMKSLDLSRIRIHSPASKFLKMNAGDAMVILPLHDKRHLNQALRVFDLYNSKSI